MSEHDVVKRTDQPVTVSSLVSDLRELGVEAGDTLLVHSSLSALGWVCGGAPAVVDALREAVTERGTVVVPTHTAHTTSPEHWENPPVPDDWIEVIHEHMPPFRPEVTPSRSVGAVPECFRDYPDAVRSYHPAYSFAAWGADAEEVVADHELAYGLGENSPLSVVYDLDGDVLLLGAGHDTNTSLHLAEYRADIDLEVEQNGGAILEDGERVWVEYDDLAISDDDFEELGEAFEDQVGLREGPVGEGTAKLASQRTLVDFAVEWFEANR